MGLPHRLWKSTGMEVPQSFWVVSSSTDLLSPWRISSSCLVKAIVTFVSCPFAEHFWEWFASVFSMDFPTGDERLQCDLLCLFICMINKPSSPSLFSYFVSRQKLGNTFVRYVSKSFITETNKKKKQKQLMRTLQSGICMKFKCKNRTVYITDLSLRILYKQSNVLIKRKL